MTIPDDVRAIIHLALIEYNRHTAMGVGVALAWLDAQPAAPTERWEPVEYLDPMPVVTITPHYDNHAYLVTIRRGNIITLHHGNGVVGSATLPDNLRLYGRVEVTP